MLCSLPTISRAVDQFGRRQLEPRQLVEYCLERIARFDERVRAWVVVDAAGARRQAEQLGARQRQGELCGPLHGIPVGIKDIIDVQGLPTRAGSALRGDQPAARDAPLVAQLRRQGAIILGKTVTTEFACFDPSPTCNPWNLGHTPGGSSSGSAAAVALQMCVAALGSQTGGSIIRPASYCGVAGLKPTFGRLSLEGIVPVSQHLDHPGPLARRVSDLWAVFCALSGDQAAGEPGQGSGPPDSPPEMGPPRLALVEPFFWERADPPMYQVTRAAIETLEAAGAELTRLGLPESFADVLAMHRRIMAFEAAQYHRPQYAAQRQAYGPNIAALIDEGLALPESEYTAALRHQRQFQSDMAGLLDPHVTAVMPATPTTAPASLRTTGDPSFNSPWSYAGLPTVCLPCGLAPDGLPCGLQLVGAAGQELPLLASAAWCDRQLHFDQTPHFPNL